jgi:predicted small lipoprotein YifL
MMHAVRAFSALLPALVIAGCGQSGPLYLPDDPSRVQAPQAESASAGEEDDTEDDDRE